MIPWSKTPIVSHLQLQQRLHGCTECTYIFWNSYEHWQDLMCQLYKYCKLIPCYLAICVGILALYSAMELTWKRNFKSWRILYNCTELMRFTCVSKQNFLNFFKRFRKAENKLLEKTFMHFNFGVTLNTWIILHNGAALMKFILFHMENNSEMCVQCNNFIKKSTYRTCNRNFMVNQTTKWKYRLYCTPIWNR
jgi:hypothetical protein